MQSVSIIIVNWNTGCFLEKCIESIETLQEKDYKLKSVVIIDNHSHDKSLESILIKEYDKFDLKVIRNESNEGFAKACNQGAKETDSDYLLFLNPDMCLLEDTIDNCFKFINRSDVNKMGVMGINLIDGAGRISRTCSRLPKKRHYLAKCIGLNLLIKRLNAFMLEWDHTEDRKVDEVMGAFFLVPRRIYEELGGFDERFFVYYEEVDFCKRLMDKGYYVFYYTGARAFHEGGGSSGQVKDYRLFYELRSRVLYQQKHYGIRNARIIAYLIYFEYFSRYVFLYMRNREGEIVHLKKAYILFAKWWHDFRDNATSR